MKRWYLAFLVIIPLLVFLVVTASNGPNAGFNRSQQLTALRNVGHRLLLTNGDSTSLVLPVREISTNEFRLAFEKKIRIYPNMLVDIFQKMYPSSNGYAVEVRAVGQTEVLYSFVLSPDSAHAIVPCLGRELPESHYTITVKLPHTSPAKVYYIAGILIICAAGGIGLYKRKRSSLTLQTATTNTPIAIGIYQFNVERQQLEVNGNIIELTGKETQLLKIFALSPNTIVERSRLLKEVWEDEGVIVTRSLDMFISKLRKKLEADPAVKLVNVHGKGYRLEVA